jgi:adenylate kinase
LRVILLGPPGAGKGTQAERIADALGVTRAASGDLFRAQRGNDTELGKLIRSYMDQGLLVPDDVTIKMVMEWINDPAQSDGFLLDGFPRTLGQAEALDWELRSKGGLDRVLYINVSKDELVRRLGGRFICRSCQTTYHAAFSPPRKQGVCDACGGELYQREDDRPEVVGRRLEVYFNETAPLVGYYSEQGKLVEINGEGTIQEVGDALVAAVSASRK